MKCELRTAGGISRFIFFRIISTSSRDPADNIAQDGVFVPAHMSGDARAGTQKPTRLEFQRTPRLMAGIVELRTQKFTTALCSAPNKRAQKIGSASVITLSFI